MRVAVIPPAVFAPSGTEVPEIFSASSGPTVPVALSTIAPGGSSSRGESSGPHTSAKISKEGRRGLIWKEGLMASYPNSVGVYLSGWSRMQDSSGRHAGLGEFSLEVFSTVKPPFVQRKMQEDSLAAVNEAMGHLYEASSIFSYMRDDLSCCRGKMRVPDNVAVKVTEVVMERDYWRLEANYGKHELEVPRKELDLAKWDLEISRKDAEASTLLLQDTGWALKLAKKKSLELALQLANQEAENKELRASNQKAAQDLAKAGPATIKRFLKSDGFKCTAQLALVDTMRFAMYRELEILRKSYPFTLEQLGSVGLPRMTSCQKIFPIITRMRRMIV